MACRRQDDSSLGQVSRIAQTSTTTSTDSSWSSTAVLVMRVLASSVTWIGTIATFWSTHARFGMARTTSWPDHVASPSRSTVCWWSRATSRHSTVVGAATLRRRLICSSPEGEAEIDGRILPRTRGKIRPDISADAQKVFQRKPLQVREAVAVGTSRLEVVVLERAAVGEQPLVCLSV